MLVTCAIKAEESTTSPTSASDASDDPVQVVPGQTATEPSVRPTSEPPASVTAPPPSRGQATADPEEVKRLRAELDLLRTDFDVARGGEDTNEAYENPISFYGFMDMGFQKLWAKDGSTLLGTGTSRAGTFVLGNVNLYMDANPTQTWRGLTELRITNYPNDALTSPAIPLLSRSEQRVNGTVNDINSADPGWNTVSWSAFVLEQSWIQNTVTDWFGVRVGYWLTPFGIWNIDHGSPTVIGLTRPQFTRGRFYPEHQLGVQAFGNVNVNAWKLGYTAYISNGKTPGALDMTGDKAYGMRLSAQTARPFPMAFGLAAYTGRYSHQIVGAQPNTLFSPSFTEDVSYRQWDVGADVSIDIASLRIRTEVSIERIDYDGAKAELVWNIPGRLTPDRTLLGWYSIAAYRLPWLGLEPYASFELYRYPTPMGEAIVVPGVGLNLHVNTSVQLKSQVTRTHFFDFTGGRDRSTQDVSMFASRLVMAF